MPLASFRLDFFLHLRFLQCFEMTGVPKVNVSNVPNKDTVFGCLNSSCSGGIEVALDCSSYIVCQPLSASSLKPCCLI